MGFENIPIARLIGPPEFRWRGQLVTLPVKAIALIARLADAPNRAFERTYLAEWLWPKADVRNARHSLSQTLYTIRKSLGPSSVITDPKALRLGRVRADIVDWEAAIAAGDWALVCDLYRGQLAEGLVVPASPSFDHWVTARRVSLATAAERAALELAASQQWQHAGVLSGVLLASDPTNTQMARVRAKALHETEGPTAAETFIDDFSGIIETSAIAVGSTLSGKANPSSASVFVGRTHAMAWLERELKKATKGTPRFALVDGEAGIGKTLLAQRFARLAALRGTRILAAVGYEPEKNVPFGAVGQWLQDLDDRDLSVAAGQAWFENLTHVFPALEGRPGSTVKAEIPGVGQHRIMESLRRLFVEMSRRKPLCMLLDDVHDADPTSLSFVHYLLRKSDSAAILLLGTVRTEPDVAENPTTAWDGVARYTLTGLDQKEVSQLVGILAPDKVPLGEETTAQLHDQAGGNPLVISILAQEDDFPEASTPPPQSIVDFFRPRLEQRSTIARQILAALAVVGEPTNDETLATITAAPLSDIDAAISELKAARLIGRDETRIALRHGLVGEVALASLSPPSKQRLHGRAARSMMATGRPPPPVMALSYDLAGNSADAFEASMRAVDACEVLHASAEKEFFLKLALSNAPSAQAEAEVRLTLARLLLQKKELQEAYNVLDLTELSISSRLQQRAALTRIEIRSELTGDPETLQRLWTEAREIARGLPALDVATAYHGIAGVAFDLGLDWIAADISRELYIELSAQPLTDEIAVRLLRPIMISGLLNGYQTAQESLAELPHPEDDDLTFFTSYHIAKATIHAAAGELVKAEEAFALSLGVAERFALADYFYTINNNLGVCLMEQGRYDEAENRLTAALEHIAPDQAPSHHFTARDNLTILAYERGHHRRAFDMATTNVSSKQISGARALVSFHTIVGLSGLEIGRLSSCREAERELRILLERHGHFSNDHSYAYVFLARMASLRGRSAKAAADLQQAAQFYRSRNKLARARLEIDRLSILVRLGSDVGADIDVLLADLQGTGAVPLIERAESLKTRAGLHDA